jgi:hypothetical protein
MSVAVPLTPTGIQISYRNSKGKNIVISISNHARQRFWSRWSYLYPHQPLDFSEVDTKIAEWFARAERLVNLSKELQNRCKRHGKDTLFFKTNGFTFVVQDATLLTVEISDRGKRHLNKKPHLILENSSLSRSRLLPNPQEGLSQCDPTAGSNKSSYSFRAGA